MTFKIAAICHLELLKFGVCVSSGIVVPRAHWDNQRLTTGCWIKLGQTTFQHGSCLQSWILDIFVSVMWLSVNSKAAFVYQISSKSEFFYCAMLCIEQKVCGRGLKICQISSLWWTLHIGAVFQDNVLFCHYIFVYVKLVCFCDSFRFYCKKNAMLENYESGWIFVSGGKSIFGIMLCSVIRIEIAFTSHCSKCNQMMLALAICALITNTCALYKYFWCFVVVGGI